MQTGAHFVRLELTESLVVEGMYTLDISIEPA